jgi:hypothetical protein
VPIFVLTPNEIVDLMLRLLRLRLVDDLAREVESVAAGGEHFAHALEVGVRT